jgi:hypothetical protein
MTGCGRIETDWRSPTAPRDPQKLSLITSFIMRKDGEAEAPKNRPQSADPRMSRAWGPCQPRRVWTYVGPEIMESL